MLPPRLRAIRREVGLGPNEGRRPSMAVAYDFGIQSATYISFGIQLRPQLQHQLIHPKNMGLPSTLLRRGDLMIETHIRGPQS